MEGSFEPLRIIAGLRARGVSFVLAGDIAAMTHGADIEPDRVEVCVDRDDEVIEHLTELLTPLGGDKVDAGDDPSIARYRTVAGMLECVALEPSAFGRMRGSASAVPLGNGVLALVADPSELAAERVASNDLVGAVRATALAERPSRQERHPHVRPPRRERRLRFERPVPKDEPIRIDDRVVSVVGEQEKVRSSPVTVDEDEYGEDREPEGRFARFLRPFERIDDFMNRLNEGGSRR